MAVDSRRRAEKRGESECAYLSCTARHLAEDQWAASARCRAARRSTTSPPLANLNVVQNAVHPAQYWAIEIHLVNSPAYSFQCFVEALIVPKGVQFWIAVPLGIVAHVHPQMMLRQRLKQRFDQRQMSYRIIQLLSMHGWRQEVRKAVYAKYPAMQSFRRFTPFATNGWPQPGTPNSNHCNNPLQNSPSLSSLRFASWSRVRPNHFWS